MLKDVIVGSYETKIKRKEKYDEVIAYMNNTKRNWMDDSMMDVKLDVKEMKGRIQNEDVVMTGSEATTQTAEELTQTNDQLTTQNINTIQNTSQIQSESFSQPHQQTCSQIPNQAYSQPNAQISNQVYSQPEAQPVPTEHTNMEWTRDVQQLGRRKQQQKNLNGEKEVDRNKVILEKDTGFTKKK